MDNKKVSSNPWLSIPWEDYEGHMASPEVRQAQFLNDIFKSVLQMYEPQSIAVLGCSAGNGFENIDPSVTQKVIGVDINPDYLEVLQDRYGSSLPDLKLICTDLAELELEAGSCDLIFCGLIFEYVDPKDLVSKIRQWLSMNGKLIVVLQLPSENSKMISETKYESLRRLKPVMRLVDPQAFQRACAQAGYTEVCAYTQLLKSKKVFFVGHYRREEGL